MASLIKVLDLYNDIATITGFPRYVDDSVAQDTTLFLFEVITEALHNILDNISTNNATMERTDIISTIDGVDTYSIAGIIKEAEVIDADGKNYRLPYNNNIDFNRTKQPTEKEGKPECYVIKNSRIRLFPTPDKTYKIKLTLSSKDIIVANNDIYRTSIRDINDQIIGTEEFATVIKLRAAALIFARCNNSITAYYSTLAKDRLKSYIERTYGSNEAIRLDNRNAGHFNVRRGLLG